MAGLWEGEGCFTLDKGKSAHAKIEMTDEDVISTVSNMLNTKYSVKRNSRNRKTSYCVLLCGENAIDFMLVVLDLMHERRKEKILNILSVATTRLGNRTQNFPKYITQRPSGKFLLRIVNKKINYRQLFEKLEDAERAKNALESK